MNLRPLSNRVLVKQDSPEETTPGGIILAQNAQEKSRKGTVIAVGPGLLTDNLLPAPGKAVGGWHDIFYRMPMPLKEGDRVIFTLYQGSSIEIEGEKLLLLNLDEVLAVLE